MDRFSPLLPLVFGHRGASKHAPENTLAAFRLALESHADGIEFDLHLSRDGQVVVMHDGQVDRTTHGSGHLARLSLEEIQRLDAGSWFGPSFAHERVPTLEQVFREFGSQLLYDLEIKNFSAPTNGLERKVIALIRRFGLEKRVLISSFNPQAIRIFRRELPEAPAMLLLIGGWAGKAEFALVGRRASPDMIGFYYREWERQSLQVCDGRKIMVWGPETGPEVIQMAQRGVNGIIVDDPGMARLALTAGMGENDLRKDKNRFVG